jgi:hypothetical protein
MYCLYVQNLCYANLVLCGKSSSDCNDTQLNKLNQTIKFHVRHSTDRYEIHTLCVCACVCVCVRANIYTDVAFTEAVHSKSLSEQTF